MKKLFGLLAVLLVLLTIGSHYNFITFPSNINNIKNLKDKKSIENILEQKDELKVINEESAITDSIEKAMPSVVTIGISKTSKQKSTFEIDPFNPFNPFREIPQEDLKIDQNIGSGFIISQDGFIVTNKHVVSDTEAQYRVITSNNKEYPVKTIARDPLNDLAILKINASNLKPLSLGDSSKLKLGNYVIAIGTPLGEFTNTVTSGIISGLGRGITAGSPYENFVERLDNVIQTDAAISPGNSGGPLINLLGQAIGVNTAVSQEGSNIGFAIPISVVKDLLKNFNDKNGTIERPFLGVRYKIIPKENALFNNVPEGAYIIEVVEQSPADKGGLQKEDIITEIDGKKITEDSDITVQKIIASKKIGDKIIIKIYRDKKIIEKTITLVIFK